MRTYIKKMLNKKMLVIFIIIILFMLIATTVMAVDNIQQLESQLTEYDLNTIGMKISLPTELTDLIIALENNDERLEKYENKEEYLKAYKQSGIIADYVDKLEEQPNTEIIVAARTSSSYASMPDFNTLTEEDMNEYTNRFVAAINEGTLVKIDNGNCYIKITSTATQEDKRLDIHMYYTIMNGRLITISFRNYQSTNTEELENTIMHSIQFYEVERPQYSTTSDEAKLAVGFATIMVVILLIIVFFIRRKDKKMLNKNIKDVTIKQYSKFGGLLVFFWTLCFYQILLRVIDISDASTLENLEFYKNAIIAQSTIVSLISMYQIYITVKRQQETPKKLIKSNIVMLIATSVITLARIIYALIRPMEVYTNEYFKQEISILITNIFYPLIWIMYFTLSRRVQTYYYLPARSYMESVKGMRVYQFVAGKILKHRKGKTNERENTKHN